MVLVQSGLKRDYIISLLDGQTIDNITFKLVKHEGMKMFFEYDNEDDALAAKVAKKTIKESEFGVALFFSVTNV
jgi:hypothetical protein